MIKYNVNNFITQDQATVVQSMKGFSSFKEISEATGIPISHLPQVIHRLR